MFSRVNALWSATTLEIMNKTVQTNARKMKTQRDQFDTSPNKSQETCCHLQFLVESTRSEGEKPRKNRKRSDSRLLGNI